MYCNFPFKWTVCEKWEAPFCLNFCLLLFFLFIGQQGGKKFRLYIKKLGVGECYGVSVIVL